MERNYAGTLGLVAFMTVMVRGQLNYGGTESTILAAIIALFIFAAIGYIVGLIASRVVDESVTNRVNAELDALQRQIDEHAVDQTTEAGS